jgi:hypothetical protein
VTPSACFSMWCSFTFRALPTDGLGALIHQGYTLGNTLQPALGCSTGPCRFRCVAGKAIARHLTPSKLFLLQLPSA